MRFHLSVPIGVAVLLLSAPSARAADPAPLSQTALDLALAHFVPSIVASERGLQELVSGADCQAWRSAYGANEFERADSIERLREEWLPAKKPPLVTIHFSGALADYNMQTKAFAIVDQPGISPNPLAVEVVQFERQSGCGGPVGMYWGGFPGYYHVRLTNPPGLAEISVDEASARSYVEKYGASRGINVTFKVRLVGTDYQGKTPEGYSGAIGKSEQDRYAVIDAEIVTLVVESDDGKIKLLERTY